MLRDGCSTADAKVSIWNAMSRSWVARSVQFCAIQPRDYWCRGTGSNCRPAAYKAAALPAKLPRQLILESTNPRAAGVKELASPRPLVPSAVIAAHPTVRHPIRLLASP